MGGLIEDTEGDIGGVAFWRDRQRVMLRVCYERYRILRENSMFFKGNSGKIIYILSWKLRETQGNLMEDSVGTLSRGTPRLFIISYPLWHIKFWKMTIVPLYKFLRL